MAPVPVQRVASLFNNATSPKTATLTQVTAGDVIVVKAINENFRNTWTMGTPTGLTGATWTLKVTAGGASNDLNCRIQIWTTTAPSNQSSVVISLTQAGTTPWFGLEVIQYPAGCTVGQTWGGQISSPTTGAPTATATSTGANSAIEMAVTDWSAGAMTGKTYRTANAGTFSETTSAQTADYTYYLGRYGDSGAIGSKQIGLSAPSTMIWSLAAVEILGSSGGSDTATMGVATATGVSPVAAAAASIGTAAAASTGPTVRAAATQAIAVGTSTAPSSTLAMSATPGVASTATVAPTVRAVAGAGSAVAAVVAPGVAAAVTRGTAAGVGIAPTDGQTDTTPTPGVATGTGIAPTARAAANAGSATAATVSPTVRVPAGVGVATGSGISPTDGSSSGATATMGVATAAGVSPGVTIRLATLQGVASVAAVAPRAAVALSVGTAVGTSASPSSILRVTPAPGVAVAVSPSPTARQPVSVGAASVVGVAPTSVRTLVAAGVAVASGISPTFTGEVPPGHVEPYAGVTRSNEPGGRLSGIDEVSGGLTGIDEVSVGLSGLVG